ncbi:MAG: hypothetical protein IJX98_01540 [Clostridia bacterium]|nr:hypothetical protein [Clostridia bacterium]
MKKTISLIFAGVLALTSLGAVGCNGSTDDGKIVLNVSAHDDALGGQWMVDLFERFEQEYEGKSYPGGKTGVVVKKNAYQNGLSTIRTDGNAVYFRNRDNSVASYVRNGEFLDITDMVTEKNEMRAGEKFSIADKIPEGSKATYMVEDKYYALPDAEFYAGVTYDKDLFDEKGLYFAQAGASGREYYSTVCEETYTFINIGDTSSKSCGPDGEFGNDDDGLPTSLFELAALCEYMKTIHSVSPFAMAYNSSIQEYCNFFFDALMASLQGSTAATMNSLQSDGFDVIVGWEDENLFPGFDGIKKPIVRTIPITEETGYYTTWSADKYYAEAFVELVDKNGWWCTDTASVNSNHHKAQDNFIYSNFGSNEAIGMLVESTYWYNEANSRNTFDYFFIEFNYVDERNLVPMSLPVSLDTSVVQGSGELPTYLCTSRSFVCVNANIAGNEGLVEAVKDFLQFIYSDGELSRCTAEQGLPRNMIYTVNDTDKSKFSSYGANVWSMFEKANIVRFEGETATFKENAALFYRGFEDGAFSIPGYGSCYPAMANGKTSKTCFEEGMKTKDQWQSVYYRGNGIVGDYEGLTYVG